METVVALIAFGKACGASDEGNARVIYVSSLYILYTGLERMR